VGRRLRGERLAGSTTDLMTVQVVCTSIDQDAVAGILSHDLCCFRASQLHCSLSCPSLTPLMHTTFPDHTSQVFNKLIWRLESERDSIVPSSYTYLSSPLASFFATSVSNNIVVLFAL